MKDIFEEADRLRNNGQSIEAAKIYKSIAEDNSVDRQDQAAAWHMSAVSLREAQNFKESKYAFEKAKGIYKELDDQSNLGRVIRDYADQLYDEGKYDESCQEFSKSEGILMDEDPGELAMTQIKLAVALNQSKDQERSNKKLLEGLANVKKSSNSFYLSTAYANAAKIYMQRGEYSTAIDYSSAALGVLDLQDDLNLKRHAEIFLSLAKCFRETNNLELANEAKTKADSCLNSIDHQTRIKVLGSI